MMFNLSFLFKTRKIYRYYIHKNSESSHIHCPDPKILNDFIEDKLLDQERTQIIDHLTTCLNCINEIRVLIASKDLSLSIRKKLEISRFFSEFKIISFLRNNMTSFFCRKRIFLKISMIFSIILIIASAFFIFHKSTFRDLDSLRGISNIQFFTYNPKEEYAYDSSSIIFSWQELESIKYYIVEIFDSDLKRIWISEELRVHIYSPPNQLRVLIQKNGIYYWMVSAKLTNGIKIESKLIKFKIR